MSVQALEPICTARHATLQELMARHGAISNIANGGYTELPWDGDWVSQHSAAARSGFWRMLDGPDRDAFRYAQATETDDKGLFEKRGELKPSLSPLEAAEGRKRYDSKFYFHCDQQTEQTLRRQGAPVGQYQDVFHACRHFNMMASRFALEIATGLDELNDQEKPEQRYRRSFRERVIGARVVTRLLRYMPQGKEDPLANLHRDRCAITVHWHSSHPGLVVYGPDKKPVPTHDTDPSQVLIFLGEKAWVATRGKYGSGVLHGVSNLTGAVPAAENRFVAVTFVHCKLDDDLEWKEAHRGDLTVNPADYPL